MRAGFLILVVIFPVIFIGLATCLTAANIVTGVWAVIMWVIAMLASIVIDAWISASYTMRRLAKKRSQEGKDHHE